MVMVVMMVVMVIVMVVIVSEGDIELCCRDPAAIDPIDGQLETANTKPQYFTLKVIEVETQIEHRPDEHIPADTREAVKIESSCHDLKLSRNLKRTGDYRCCHFRVQVLADCLIDFVLGHCFDNGREAVKIVGAETVEFDARELIGDAAIGG